MPTDDITTVMDQDQTTPTPGSDAVPSAAPSPNSERPSPAPGDTGPGAGAPARSPSLPSDLAEDLAQIVPDAKNLAMLLDVSLKVTIELGRTRMKFRDVLNLHNGSIIELTKQTSEPVDILVNGALLATGEVVVVDDHFAVRITKLLSRVERLRKVL